MRAGDGSTRLVSMGLRVAGRCPHHHLAWSSRCTRPVCDREVGQLGSLVPIPGGIGGVDAGVIGTLVLTASTRPRPSSR